MLHKSLCEGISHIQMLACTCRVREAVRSNLPIVDVDGSYLYRKQLRLGGASDDAQLPLPTPPLSGWESVNSENASDMSSNVPRVTQG